MAAIDVQDCVLSVTVPGGRGTSLGTAFLVGSDGLAVTCYHSISKYTILDLTFQPTGQTITADLIPEMSDSALDIAILRLRERPPDALCVLQPATDCDRDMPFDSYGFPQGTGGYTAKGTVRGLVPHPPEAPQTLKGTLYQLTTTDVAEGMSGAPVVLSGTDIAVGMILIGNRTQWNTHSDLAYARPLQAVLDLIHLELAVPPIESEADWLKAIGLADNRFGYPDGGKDPDLESHFHTGPALYFTEVLTRCETVFMFAGPGCGKSAYRKMLEIACLNEAAGFKILPVPVLSLQDLLDKRKRGDAIGPEDHVALFLKAGINGLVSALEKGHLAVAAGTSKENRDFMWVYVQEHGRHITPEIHSQLKDLLNPSTGIKYGLADHPVDKLHNFCKTAIKTFGFKYVYFIVDVKVPSVAEWPVMDPLFLDEQMLDISASNGAFKFFLDVRLQANIRSMPAVRPEMIRLSPITWSDRNELKQILLLRLRPRSGTTPETILSKMFERGESVERILDEAHENPGRLITLFRQLISEHLSRFPFSEEYIPITQNEVERVITSIGPAAWHASNTDVTAASSTELDSQAVQGIIARGESERVEFKSTLRYDLEHSRRERHVEKAAAIALCGLLNSTGGTLLIGVEDNGNVLGLDNDLSTLHENSYDDFRRALADIIETFIGTEFAQYILCEFVAVAGKTLCVIHVQPSDESVYFEDGGTVEFYVRSGSSTRKLDVKAAMNYMHSHWRK